MEQLVIYTLFGNSILFIMSLAILFIALLISDIKESGVAATVFFVIFVTLNIFGGDLPILDYLTWGNVGLYVGIGLVFAIIRTFFKGKELTSKYKALDDNNYDKKGKTLKEYKSNYDLKSSIFRWWFLFPFSVITWVCGSIFIDLKNFIYRKLGGVFETIFNA